MALLALLLRWAGERGISLHAATVDHGLRPEARSEAEMVAAFCADRHVPHEILTIGPLDGRGNLSANARDARYAALCAWAGRHALAVVAVGHTMDDQAETVLMRLARGSGVEGLSAMAQEREFAGITWVRPLLGLRRAVLRDWLCAEGIAWVNDPTNEDNGYERVKARRALAALGPLGITPEGLAETAAILARQRRVLDAAADAYRCDAVRTGAVGSVTISRAPRQPVERDTLLRVFAEVLQSIGRSEYRPRFRALEPLWDWAFATRENTSRTLSGCIILPCPDRNEISIFREYAAQPPLSPPDGAWDGWSFDTAPDGVWVGALGKGGDTHLMRSGADQNSVWCDLPRALRITAPALYDSDTGSPEALVAVPHAGWARDPVFGDLAVVRQTSLARSARTLRR